MSHNITLRQFIRGLLILGLVMMAVLVATSSRSLAAAGGILFIVSHLVLASGVLMWGISRLVRFIQQLHQPLN